MLSSQKSPAGGSLRSLLRELRADFSLLAQLDDRSDWERLKRFSQQGLDRTQEFLADQRLTLLRPKTLHELEEDLQHGHSTAILGESGAGKSGLAKIIARRWRQGSVIWFDAAGVDVADQFDLERKVGVRRPLEQLLPLVPDRHPLLVLDGLEHWPPGGMACASLLLRVAAQCPDWTILITVRADRWPNVREELLRHGTTFESLKTHSLDLPTRQDLQDVWLVFPSLISLAVRPELARILRNLQVLSLLSLSSKLQGSSDSLRYPSQLIDDLWERWITHGVDRLSRSNTLKALARLEAERLGASSGISSFEGREVVLQNLE
jgi:hypothetical protein